MVRIIYTSAFKAGIDHSEINKIHATSHANNVKWQVTGMLCFGSRKFLQCLEGDRDRVNALFQKISRDPRHEEITILKYDSIHEREFDRFSMKLILLTKAANKAVARFSGTETFDPYLMSGETALRMMLSLREHIPTDPPENKTPKPAPT